MTEEIVVLVDEQNNILGTTPKATVHTDNTPLHRAFSLFLFKDGKLLLQQKQQSEHEVLFSPRLSQFTPPYLDPDTFHRSTQI